MNKNSFINQFAENIKFHYTNFNRAIIRGYILHFFSLACVVRFLKIMVFSKQTNIKNPKSLGLKKPELFFQACLWYGLECNDRLLNCCADVDI